MLTILLLLGTETAWAAPMIKIAPDRGVPGSDFTIRGSGFVPGASVEIRWDNQNSGAVLGTVTAEADGGFSLPVTVPDSVPNSHPVIAVMRSGNSVSTSTASYQVTPGEPVQPTTTPTTTSTQQSQQSSQQSSRNNSGVSGGITSDPAETTTGATTPPRIVASSPSSSTPGPPDASTTTLPTVPISNASQSGGGTEVLPGTSDSGRPLSAADAATAAGTALGIGSTAAAKSGPVRSPGLLLLGLGMVFAGGIILAVRNRHRV